MSIEEIISCLEANATDMEDEYPSPLGTLEARPLREAAKMIQDMHNELCLKCGNYKNEHLGACNGCKWKKEET